VATPDYVGPTAAQAAVLPARAAYLIRDGSDSGLRRAVQEACTRWGGMTEPIIPVKPGGEVDPWWQQVVSLAGVEGAVNIDVEQSDASTAAAELGLSSVPIDLIDQVGLTAFTVHPSAIGPPSLPGHNAYVMASERLQLWEVIGAGDLIRQHQFVRWSRCGVMTRGRPLRDYLTAR